MATYSLSADGVMPDVIRRRMIGFPDLEIARRDIVGLKMRAEGLVVHGAERDQMILIPREIDGFDVLAADLADEHGAPVAAGAALPPMVRVLGPTVAVLAVLATVFISTNPLLVAPLALLLTAGAVWTIVIVRRSPHANPQMKAGDVDDAAPCAFRPDARMDARWRRLVAASLAARGIE
jgi:hypothetical protein